MKKYLQKNTTNYFSRLSELVDEELNENWMKDWIEQTASYKNNPEALKLIGNDIEGFLQYEDYVEGKEIQLKSLY